MKNSQQQHQRNVMAEDAMIQPASTQPTTANEPAAINPTLQRWADFVDQLRSEHGPVHQDDEVAPFIKEAEEIRKTRAEKRLNAKLRKREVEQKGILLAEAQKSLSEAHRKFESAPQVPYDYTFRPPSSINDLLRAEKARNELKTLEREQKEELLKQVMEKRAKELGEQWPPAEEMPDKLRFDHIPKPWPGYKEIMAKAFPGAQAVEPQESNE